MSNLLDLLSEVAIGMQKVSGEVYHTQYIEIKDNFRVC